MPGRLENAGIVVTRPAGAEDRLARLLGAEGARVLAFPAFRIVPLGNKSRRGPPLLPAPDGIFDAVLFTSPTAVRLGVPPLRGRLPADILAPGRGTGKALAETGIAGVFMPATGAGLEPLLDSLPTKWLGGKRLLVVCGEPINRSNLRELEAHGASVTPFPVYARRAARSPHPLPEWIRGGEADAIMASSAAAVEVLGKLLGDNAGKLCWIASSSRVADAVKRTGAKRVVVAASAEAGEMTAAAIEWWQAKDAHDRQA